MTQLAPNIRLALIDRRVVLLDLEQDRYRMLHSDAAAALRALVVDGDAGDPTLVTRLSELGILEPGNAPVRQATMRAPVRSALEVAPHIGNGPGLYEIGQAILQASWGLRFRGLAAMISRAQRRAAHAQPVGLDMASFAACYARRRQIWPQRWICLRDSLAFHDVLLRAGGAATLVIGVRLDPFAAHCWVQSGDMVLNDRRDAVVAFTPILTL